MARAWVFGDDLDTDQIVPGRYAPFMVGQDRFHTYAFCDVLVGGENFGCGSSREYAVAALKKHGIGGIVAKSFARIFFRNCVNLGIPVVEAPDPLAVVRDADEVTLDLAAGLLRAPRGDVQLRPVPAFARQILTAGGVGACLREHDDILRWASGLGAADLERALEDA